MANNNVSIAFCGIDGTGKGTQIENVRQKLQSQGFDVLPARLNFFPLNDYGNSKIKDVILKMQSGFEIVRAYTNFHFASKRNDFTLYDRHIICYLAYAYAMGVNQTLLLKRGFSLYPPTRDPDLTLYFDIDVQTALERIEDRTKVRQRDKSENYDTLSRAQEGYELLLPHVRKVARIDARKSNGEVLNQIEVALVKKIDNYLIK